METEGQSHQRVGGGRSFWLLCVVVVFVLWLTIWVDFFVRESKRFMVEQNLILFSPWCYNATQKYHDMRRGICRTNIRYGTKMYGIRNYYRPLLDEASKIIWKILLR